jgi:tryptophan-rich sensory protein
MVNLSEITLPPQAIAWIEIIVLIAFVFGEWFPTPSGEGSEIDRLYSEIRTKIEMAPDKRIFGIVWTILYVTLVCILFKWISYHWDSHVFSPVIFMLVVIVVICKIWTSIFFVQKQFGQALLLSIGLTLCSVWSMVWIIQAGEKMGYILLPLSIWGLFASYLSWKVWRIGISPPYANV